MGYLAFRLTWREAVWQTGRLLLVAASCALFLGCICFLLLLSKGGNKVKSVAVRRMGREAARTIASSAEPYRKEFVPTSRATKGDFTNMQARNMLKWLHMWNLTIFLTMALLSTPVFGSPGNAFPLRITAAMLEMTCKDV